MQIKRVVDIVLALIGLLILSPIFLIIAASIKLDSKGPILFKQNRIGMNKKQFNILKFRTMAANAPKNCPTHLLNNPELYITKVGKFLRKSSLDELPQLINIVKGDMSIVGPRPALWNQDDLIREREKYNANDVLPGLTGWAQINGRDELDIRTKAKLDGIYIKHQGVLMDLACIAGTVINVIFQNGVVEGKFKQGE